MVTLFGTLRYPEHLFTPADFLHFVECNEFADDWHELGLDVENDLWALQTAIMCNPKGGAVIPDTGGLRKFRFAPTKWHSGKSGAVRVCYVYFEEFAVVLLVVAYGKNQKENLAPDEKRGIREYIRQCRKYLAKSSYS